VLLREFLRIEQARCCLQRAPGLLEPARIRHQHPEVELGRGVLHRIAHGRIVVEAGPELLLDCCPRLLHDHAMVTP
jgi:hypothetical protein